VSRWKSDCEFSAPPGCLAHLLLAHIAIVREHVVKVGQVSVAVVVEVAALVVQRTIGEVRLVGYAVLVAVGSRAGRGNLRSSPRIWFAARKDWPGGRSHKVLE
jgi:hypothetical protein